MKTILSELTGVFREIFDQPDLEVTEQMTARDVEGWDSITYISLVIAVEEHFKIRLSITEISKLQDVGEMVQLISEKTKVLK